MAQASHDEHVPLWQRARPQHITRRVKPVSNQKTHPVSITEFTFQEFVDMSVRSVHRQQEQHAANMARQYVRRVVRVVEERGVNAARPLYVGAALDTHFKVEGVSPDHIKLAKQLFREGLKAALL